ncbi:hypothetical protein [Klebsiella phage ST405-OXA48phi1.3]|nr:hypothetical protein [Klebsiella phage ST405-OXA48phi1.3]
MQITLYSRFQAFVFKNIKPCSSRVYMNVFVQALYSTI